MTPEEIVAGVQAAVERSRGETDWGISEETFQYWKANAGNAKARRRWRRRNIPNTQKAIGAAETAFRRFDATTWSVP